MNNTHIDIGLHHYALSSFKHREFDDLRVCLYLKKEDESFVDSLDIDYMTGRIRFYGCMKDYSLKRIPKEKKKLWNCDNFRKMIIEKLVNAEFFRAPEEHSTLYSISLQSIVDKCIV